MKRILFVDDETAVLDGIRRALRADKGNWEMQFAVGAEQALQAFEHVAFDIVISDMRMPGTDGATLLAEIRQRFPEATRIVLSGYSEAALATRAASDAHRVLAKPCNALDLKRTIEKVITLQDLIASPELRHIVGKVGELPSLGSTYISLGEAVRDPYVTIEQVAAIVERDVAMAAKVLQLTNSAFFGLPRQIASLSDAVSYLGISTIKNLALTSEVFKVFKPGPKIPVSECDAIQDHAIRVASIIGTLPVQRHLRDLAVIAGILHDIGKLLMATKMQDVYCAIRSQVKAAGCPWHVAEREILGTSHAEVGAYLLGLWGIPELAVEAIAHHHEPDRISHSEFDCTIALYVADVLAHEVEAESGSADGREAPEQQKDLLQRLGLLSRIEEFRELAAETFSRR